MELEPFVAMIEPGTGRRVRVLVRDRAAYEANGHVLGEREPGADDAKSPQPVAEAAQTPPAAEEDENADDEPEGEAAAEAAEPPSGGITRPARMSGRNRGG